MLGNSRNVWATSSYSRPHERADPPPPYKPTEQGTATDISRRHSNHQPRRPATGQSVLKVSMLPISGGDFVFLDSICRSGREVRVPKQSRRARSHLFSRIVKCDEHTISASKQPIGADETGKMATTPLNCIGPGEIERRIGIFYDWTRDWDLVLSTHNESKASRGGSGTGDEWRTYAQLYFNDLSDLGSKAVPWNDAARTQRLVADVLPQEEVKKGWLRFTWKFCERSENPRWGARFIIFYKGRGVLAGVDGSGPIAGIERPWRFFDTKDCVMAEMDCRTGAGCYKKVMWYNSKHGYGNDVLHEPLEARKSAHDARYAEFVKGLLPQRP